MAKYSIILPVRNGGHYIKECVNSILTQSLNDFNLLVLDNASTDDTVAWLTSLNDNRIQIFPAERPLTIEENWERALTLETNEFVTLIGHDDILYKDYLLTIDKLIQKHPGASLYQTHFSYIDANGGLIKRCMPMDEVQYAHDFLAFSLESMIDIMGTGFMMRAVDYKAVGGIPPNYPNLLFADFELWMNLTLKGYKATAFTECFNFRKHLSTTSISPDVKMQKAFFIFLDYLKKLKHEDSLLSEAITRHAEKFIHAYCKGLSHRLLRTPYKKRSGETVANYIAKCRQAANDLIPGNNFNPEETFSIKMAIWIDSNFITRRLFLLFKKIYAKPVYN